MTRNTIQGKAKTLFQLFFNAEMVLLVKRLEWRTSTSLAIMLAAISNNAASQKARDRHS